MLELEELLEFFNKEKTLTMDEEATEACNYYANEAQKITCELNYSYHDLDEIREIFSKLIGKKVDDLFRVFRRSILISARTYIWERTFSSTATASFKIRAESISAITC